MRRDASERGMSAIETMLVLLTLTILSSMIVNSIRRFTSAHAYSEGQARMHEVGDRVSRVVSDDASIASHVFTTTGEAAEYLARCDLAGMVPFQPRAPTATERGYFTKDTATSATTGNFLFLAKACAPFRADLSGDRTVIATVGSYRLVLYMPVVTPGRSLDLARWVSHKVARLNDIQRVLDPVRRTLLGQKLYDEGFRFAWEPGRPIATGLQLITAAGGLLLPGVDDKVPGEQGELRPALLQVSRMALAANGALPSIQVPAFAIAQGGGFPGGFEVKVDGTGAGRMILVRLVVVGTIFDGSRNALAFTRTMSNRGTM